MPSNRKEIILYAFDMLVAGVDKKCPDISAKYNIATAINLHGGNEIGFNIWNELASWQSSLHLKNILQPARQV